MSLSGNILVTQIAWNAGKKAYGYIPDSVKSFLGLSDDDSEKQLDYLINNVATDREVTIDISDINKSKKYVLIEPSAPDLYNVDSFNKNTGVGYHTCFLKMINPNSSNSSMVEYINEVDNNILKIPCVNGCPKIEFSTQGNRMPIASNQKGLTTNIVVNPTKIFFEFEIAYLRILGINNPNREAQDVDTLASRYYKFKKAVKDATRGIVDLGISDMDEEDNLYQVRDRSIFTFQQIYKYLNQFNTNKPCWLYLGFTDRIPVSVNMKINAGKGDMDCVSVQLELTELALTTFYGALGTTEDKTNKTTTETSSVSTGETKKQTEIID